jgi:hypothetical protein
MITRAYKNGVEAASKRFGVREASLLDMLLGATVTAPAANVALRRFAPGVAGKINAAKAGLERAWEVPIAGAQTFGSKALQALRGPRSPEDVLLHALSQAPHSQTSPLSDLGSVVHRLGPPK